MAGYPPYGGGGYGGGGYPPYGGGGGGYPAGGYPSGGYPAGGYNQYPPGASGPGYGVPPVGQPVVQPAYPPGATGGYGAYNQNAAPVQAFGGRTSAFGANPDRFRTLDELINGLRVAGVGAMNIMMGIDYTKSNEFTGKFSFLGKNLHTLDPYNYNPYQRAIDIIGRTIEPFDDDGMIPVYGFGDVSTTDRAVFPFYPDERPCFRTQEVLRRYAEITPTIRMSGPTSFKPIIDKAINLCARQRRFQLLVIICDGDPNNDPPTRQAIQQASNYPISIICIGVGDGPFPLLESYDDKMLASRFDNFNFVNFHRLMTTPNITHVDTTFAVNCLMELPDQFIACRRLGYIV